MERGLGYIALGPADAAVAFARTAGAARTPCLWITDRSAEPAPPGGHLLRVTTLPEAAAAVDPKRLADLRSAAAAFLGDSADGIVLLDCLEYLVLHNGLERVERALANLHDEVTMRGGSLVVFVNARVANPRLVAWLERELDPFPPAVDWVSEREGVVT